MRIYYEADNDEDGDDDDYNDDEVYNDDDKDDDSNDYVDVCVCGGLRAQ